jgi:uncharacterized protein, YhcH/YjgK/YiaL family
MILDKIENAHFYFAISDNLKKGFDFITSTDLINKEVGKYEIDGKEVFAMISEYESKAHEDCRPEAHKAYADIQFIISGKEAIGYAPLSGQTPTTEFNPDKDIVFYASETVQLNLETGMFAVFFPQDVHRPCMQIDGPEKVKKVVVKVKL